MPFEMLAATVPGFPGSTTDRVTLRGSAWKSADHLEDVREMVRAGAGDVVEVPRWPVTAEKCLHGCLHGSDRMDCATAEARLSP